MAVFQCPAAVVTAAVVAVESPDLQLATITVAAVIVEVVVPTAAAVESVALEDLNKYSC